MEVADSVHHQSPVRPPHLPAPRVLIASLRGLCPPPRTEWAPPSAVTSQSPSLSRPGQGGQKQASPRECTAHEVYSSIASRYCGTFPTSSGEPASAHPARRLRGRPRCAGLQGHSAAGRGARRRPGAWPVGGPAAPLVPVDVSSGHRPRYSKWRTEVSGGALLWDHPVSSHSFGFCFVYLGALLSGAHVFLFAVCPRRTGLSSS